VESTVTELISAKEGVANQLSVCRSKLANAEQQLAAATEVGTV
jgi:hypothetical protein